MANSSKYIINSTNGNTYFNFDLEYGALTLAGGEISFVGSRKADSVYVSSRMSIDFSQAGFGADRLYLTGAWSDYAIAATSEVITLIRISDQREVIKVSALDTTDLIVFKNGSISSSDVMTAIRAENMAPVLNAELISGAPEILATATTQMKAVATSAAMTAVSFGYGTKLMLVGGRGIDMVYVKDGSDVDATQMGFGSDVVYMRGAWADYIKTAAEDTITFSRQISLAGSLVVERIVVAAFAGAGNDQLVFADGAIESNAARLALYSHTADRLNAISTFNSALVTPGLDAKAPAALSVVEQGSNNLSDARMNSSESTMTTFRVKLSTTGSLAIAEDKVTLLLNGAAFGTPKTYTLTASDITNGYVDFTVLKADLGADGNKSLTAQLTDAAGNVSAVSLAQNFTLDTTAPAAPSVVEQGSSDLSDARMSATESVMTTFRVKLATTGALAVAGDKVALLLNGAAFSTPKTYILTANDIANGYADFTALKAELGADGSKNLTAQITDAANNVSAASVALSFTLDTTAPSAPSLAEQGSNDLGDARMNASESAMTIFRVKLATTGSLAVAGDKVALLLNGAAFSIPKIYTLTASDITNGYVDLIALKADLLADGSKSLMAQITDAAGNVSATSAVLSFTLDSTAPGAPTVVEQGSSDISDGRMNASESVTTTFRVKLATTGTQAEVGDKVELLLNGSPFGTPKAYALTASDITNGYADFSVVKADQGADGSKSIAAQITDAVGNVSAASVALSFTLDTTAPVFSAVTPADNTSSIVENSNIVLTFVESIIVGSGNIVISNSAGDTRTIAATDTSQVSINGNTVTINPSSDFKAGYSYSVQIDNGVFKDASGNSYEGIADTTSLNFSVKNPLSSLLTDIRSIETFSNPGSPGQVVNGLVANALPNAVLSYNSGSLPSASNSAATYPGDARATPGAYQVDVSYLNNTFGNMGSGSTSGLSSTAQGAKEIQLSSSALSKYLGVKIDTKGVITSITKEAFSVFTHNASVAQFSDLIFSTTNNSLIGQQIDNFKKEQFSFYVAGRVASDTTAGNDSLAADTRKVPNSILAMVDTMQSDAAKYSIVSQYNAALKMNSNNATDFGSNGFSNIEALFGATLHIKSSSAAFGITTGEIFDAKFNEGFLIGYGYVIGFYGLRNVLVEMWQAKNTGQTQTITISQKDIHIIYDAASNSFYFDGTPININEMYPSGFHYGAILSRNTDLPAVSYANWGISSLDPTSFNLGYSSGLIESSQIGAGTLISDSSKVASYKVGYSEISSGKSIILKGDDTYFLLPSVSAPTGNHIDLTTVTGLPEITSFDQLKSDAVGTHLYYRYWGASDFIYLDANNYSALPANQQLQLIYTTGNASAERLQNAQETWANKAWILGTVANRDYLETIGSSDFTYDSVTSSGEAGIIDASAAMGNLTLEIDATVATVKLGIGNNFIRDSNVNQTTYVFNNYSKKTDGVYIEGFDITGSFTDKIDLRQLGTTLDRSSLSTSIVQNYNTHSDDPGSKTAIYYDNYHSVVAASFTVSGSASKYTILMGITSDTALDNSMINTASIFVI